MNEEVCKKALNIADRYIIGCGGSDNRGGWCLERVWGNGDCHNASI